MRKKLLAMGLLLMLLLSSSCSDSGSTPSTPTAPPPQANCVLTKDPLIVGDILSGYWSISGSVKNIGDGVARNVKITFYFYHNQNDTAPFASAFSYTTPSTLQPGQEGTYSIVKQIWVSTLYWDYKITWD